MRVRWTADAADDLERIYDYIAETSPDSARRTARTIVEGVASLHSFPNRGRPGRVEGMREFVFAPRKSGDVIVGATPGPLHTAHREAAELDRSDQFIHIL